MIVGQEKCPTTKKTHYQGYIELTSKQRLSALMKVAPKTHFEARKGSQEQAIQYCQKDGDFIEYGEKNQQGKRTDIHGMKEIVKKGATIKEIHEMAPCYQTLRFALSYMEWHGQKRNWKTNVIWIWGPSRTGKSTLAKAMLPNAYIKSGTTKWWKQYDGEEDVIIDDFRDSSVPLVDLLALMDGVPYTVEYKGGERQFLARNLIITTLMEPKHQYREAKHEPKIQLYGRISMMIYTGLDGNYFKEEIEDDEFTMRY